MDLLARTLGGDGAGCALTTAAGLLYGGYTVLNVAGYYMIRVLERR